MSTTIRHQDNRGIIVEPHGKIVGLRNGFKLLFLKLQRLVLGEDGEVETQYFRVGDTIEFDVIEKVAYGTERNVYRASSHEKIRFF